MKNFKSKKQNVSNMQQSNPKKRVFKKYERLKNKVEILYHSTRKRIKGSVRLEIVFISSVCLVGAMGVFANLSHAINQTNLGRNESMDYDASKAQVQSKLLNTVNQINHLENAKLKIDIDLERLKEIISQNTQVDATYVLADYINNAWHMVYEGDESNRGELYIKKENSEIGDKDTSLLYESLQQLRMENTWSDKTVREQIEQFYTKQGITQEALKQEMIKEAVRRIDEDTYEVMDTNTYLIDSKGNMMYQEGFIQSLDIVKVIKKANNNTYEGENNTFTSIYPVIYDNQVYYLFNDSILRGHIQYYYTGVGRFVGLVTGSIVFILLLFKFTKRKIAYIEYLSHCLGEISKGDLAYEVEVVGEDELAKVAKDITHMENQIKLQIEAQMRAEKVKNELITNVAHDLRTPLTSIIGYIGLVKDKRFTTQEEEDKYLDIAYAKSEKLKVLIEDLFEFTKLHNQDIELKKENMSVTNLINQLIEELMPLAEDREIAVETFIEAKDTTIKADIQKLTRVFENLIENAIKYSQEGSTIYVEIKEVGEEVFVAVKNGCAYMPQEDIDRLFDRFYRADKSRTSIAGGSGLGLAIAKNIVELHGGQIGATLNGDYISFNVSLYK